MAKIVITLLGPPASGKTKFAKLIANAASEYHVTLYDNVLQTDPTEYGNRDSKNKMTIICMTSEE